MTVISSAVSVSLRTGASAARLTARPSAAAMAVPPKATSRMISPRRLSTSSISVSGRATCSAIPDEIGTVTSRA